MTTLVTTYGKFCPPHKGHELLFNKMKEVADNLGYSKLEADMLIMTTNGDKFFDFDETYTFLVEMMPEHSKRILPKPVDNFLDELKNAQQIFGYDNLVFVVGEDRVAEMSNKLHKYNKKLYTFDKIMTINAGNRSDEIDSVSGMSSTKLREFVRKNDYESYYKMMPESGSKYLKKDIFNYIKERI